jgi:hypothetical protein
MSLGCWRASYRGDEDSRRFREEPRRLEDGFRPRRAKFAAGTLERIAAVLAEGEERTAFIREAVEREIKRRESARPIKRGHK